MVTMMAMGDTLARTKSGYGDPFQHVMNELEKADLRFLNLETVLTPETEPVAKKWIHVRTDPSAVQFLKDAGIDAVNVAHNHILDYGEDGRLRTKALLCEHGIAPICSVPFICRCNGLTIAMAGFFLYPDDDRGEDVLDTVRKIRDRCDVLIVSLHWGTEHAQRPSPGQIQLAHRIIDEGAHLILGHHPHRVQGIERYGKGLIAYSLGNFNFWQWDVETHWYNQLSIILRVTLSRDGVLDHGLKLLWIGEDYIPWPFIMPAKTDFAPYFNKLCAEIHNKSGDWKGWYEEIGPVYVAQSFRSFAVTIRRYGWPGIVKFLRWLMFRHTWRAIAGALRSICRNLNRNDDD
jgi:hypothetical protein